MAHDEAANLVSDEGAQYFADALEVNKTVTLLDLFGGLQNGCVFVCVYVLRRGFVGNEIGREGTECIQKALEKSPIVRHVSVGCV